MTAPMEDARAMVTFARTTVYRKLVDRNEPGYQFDTLAEAIELDRSCLQDDPEIEFVFGDWQISEVVTVEKIEKAS